MFRSTTKLSIGSLLTTSRRNFSLKINLEGGWIVMLVLRICNYTSTYILWSLMLSKNTYALQIIKNYGLVHAACRFFNLLKVDMILNPTDIEPIRASINKSLLYTTGGEVSAEFYGLPQINPYIILLNVGYPMNFYWRKSRNAFGFNYLFTSLHIHFKTVLSLLTGLLQTVSFLSQM